MGDGAAVAASSSVCHRVGAVLHHRDRGDAGAVDRSGRSEQAGDAPEVPAAVAGASVRHRQFRPQPVVACGVGGASNAVFGTLIGAAAGYFRPLDNVLMRINDALMAFPAVLLAIGVTAVLGPSVNDVIIALGGGYTPAP